MPEKDIKGLELSEVLTVSVSVLRSLFSLFNPTAKILILQGRCFQRGVTSLIQQCKKAGKNKLTENRQHRIKTCVF